MILELLKFQNQIKIYHWSCETYSQHKVFGDLYEKIDALFDKFVESYMGAAGGRLYLDKDVSIDKLNSFQKENSIKYLAEFVNYLNSDFEKSCKDKKDLLNIRDEIVSEIHVSIYLLNLSDS